MADKIIDLGSGFWNIQGSFKVGGILDVGTQCSLVQLESGKFIFLDSYTLSGEVREKVMALTDNGQNVEAILNLHPFHTVHCAQMAKDFPNAINYGSSRHNTVVSEVDWSELLVESDDVANLYPELEFSLPKGIYYIHPNDKIHASSLLAYHKASKTIHVDDTFVTPPGKILKTLLPELNLHPTTKKALKDDPNAGQAYLDWAYGLATQWRETKNLCAAHSGILKFEEGEFETALKITLDKAAHKLAS